MTPRAEEVAEQRHWLPPAWKLIGTFVLVGLCAWGGITLTRESGRITTIWLANGLLLALLLSSRRRGWPLYVLLGLLGNLTANLLAGDALVYGLGLALCNTIEVLLAMQLIARQAPFDLRRPRALTALLLFGVLLAPAVSSLLAALWLTIMTGHAAWAVIPRWYVSDALGIATVTPCVWAFQRGRLRERFAGAGIVPSFAVLLLLAVVTAMVFSNELRLPPYTLFPFLVLVVWRLGFAGGAVGGMIVAGLSIGLTVAGHGPLMAIADLPLRYLVLQLWIASGLLTALPFAALLEERASLEQAVRRSESIYRLLFERVGEALFLYPRLPSGRPGRFAKVNDMACRYLAFSREELMERSPIDVLEPGQEADATATVAGLLPGAPVHVERTLLAKDGRRIPVEISAHLVDVEGGTHVLSIVRDITERRQMLAELRAQQETLEHLAASVPGVTFQWQPLADGSSGRFLYASPRALEVFGADLSKLDAGMTVINDWVIPEDRAVMQETMRQAVREGAEWSHRFRIRRADGQVGWVHGMARPSRLADGRGVFNGIFLDITEQRRLELELQQSQKLEGINQLAGGIAHDFNNILTGILGYAELVEDMARCHDPVDPELLVQIRRAAERGAGLTKRLLAFSRQQVIAPRDVELGVVVGEMQPFLERMVGAAITLVLVPTRASCVVHVDPGQLQQILLNLVINARDATPAGGTVVLAIETTDVPPGNDLAGGQYVVLRVSDTGSGMSPDVLGRVFEPFFTTKQLGKGTGLGLATVRSIVAQAKGKVEIDSVVGSGTTFRVFLPRRRAVRPSQPVSEYREEGPQPARGSVLLVEDDDSIRTVVQLTLVRAGFDVLAARHPAEALAIMGGRPERLQLLVTDMVMPGMSGKELLGIMRRSQPDLPALVLSGFTTEDLSDLGHDGAQHRFLAKPFGPEELIEAADDLLRAVECPLAVR